MSTRKTANVVVEAFMSRKARRGANMWTDGRTVYSYEMPIARHVGNKVYVVNKGPSVTTSKHIGWVRGHVAQPLQVEVGRIPEQNDDYIPVKYWTMYDIKLHNRQKGYFFFEPATLRFFSSRVSEEVYQGPGGIYFVTSEQNRGMDGTYPRMYTVRVFNPETGDVDTKGEFQQYSSRSGAHAAAKRYSVG